MKFKFNDESTQWWKSLGNDSMLMAGTPSEVEPDNIIPFTGNEQRIVFGQLVKMLRSKEGLSIEEFSEAEDLDCEEVLCIEHDPSHIPDPRTVYQISRRFQIPEDKLMQLAGVTELRDMDTVNAGLKFAARSESPDKLDSQQIQALEEFVRLLCEK